jgi:hypothetical protein
MLYTTNNIFCTLLFQASMPLQYWVESLHTTTYLLYHLPTKTIIASCPYTALYNKPPNYEHLWVFGCACYTILSVTPPHNLTPCSIRWVFISYSLDLKGYRCLDLSTNHIVIFRHVIFDEAYFPFVASPPITNDYEFSSEMDPMHTPIGTRLSACTSTTKASGPTAPPGGPTACPTRDSMTPFGSLTAPPGGLTTRVADGGSPTSRVAEAEGLTGPL